MNNKKLIRFVESFLLLPMTISIPLGNIPSPSPIVQAPQISVLSKLNMEATGILAFNQAVDQKAKETLEAKAKAIDTYFGEHKMPLEGQGMKMVQEAEKNNIDWHLLPAIAVRESTGGIHACTGATHSFFGWGSCKINFNSDEESIEIVAKHLGGNDPKTARHYDDKTTYQILRKYNSYIVKYPEQVLKIMDDIGSNFNDTESANKA